MVVRGAKNVVESAQNSLEDYADTRINELKRDFADSLPILTKKVAESLKFSLMGQASGDARVEKGLNEAVVSDLVNAENPMVGMILDQFPQAKKYLMKNPQAVPYVLQMLQRFGGKTQGGTGAGNGGLLPLDK